jgi:hypothetical protein
MSSSEYLSDFTAFRNKIQAPSLRAIADHWNAARGSHRMPGWAQFKPSAVASHLGGLWSFDYAPASGEFTGRMAGSNIMVGFGKSFMGTPLRDLHPPHVFEEARRIFTRIVTEPACVRFSGKLFKVGETVEEGERIALPMGTEAGVEGVLGASHYDYPVLRTPDKLELLHDIADWCRL